MSFSFSGIAWSEGAVQFLFFPMSLKEMSKNCLHCSELSGDTQGTAFYPNLDHWWKWWHSLDMRLEATKNSCRHHGMKALRGCNKPAGSWRQELLAEE